MITRYRNISGYLNTVLLAGKLLFIINSNIFHLYIIYI